MTSVEPVTPATYTAYQITPGNATQIVTTLMPALAAMGYIGIVSCYSPAPSALSWTLTLKRAGFQDRIANTGDYVIVSSANTASVVAQSDYASTYQPTG